MKYLYNVFSDQNKTSFLAEFCWINSNLILRNYLHKLQSVSIIGSTETIATWYCSMHTATRGPGRRKQHYSQATFNMHMEVSLVNKCKLFVICQPSVLCCSVLNQCHVSKANWSSSLRQFFLLKGLFKLARGIHI